MRLAVVVLSLSFALSSVAMANPRSQARGQNAPSVPVEETVELDDVSTRTRVVGRGHDLDQGTPGAIRAATLARLVRSPAQEERCSFTPNRWAPTARAS